MALRAASFCPTLGRGLSTAVLGSVVGLPRSGVSGVSGPGCASSWLLHLRTASGLRDTGGVGSEPRPSPTRPPQGGLGAHDPRGRGFSALPAGEGAAKAPADGGPSSSRAAATVLDGRRVSQQWLSEIAEDVANLREQGHRPPSLAVVLVGNRADSVLYVNRKRQAAANVGIDFDLIELPEKVTQVRLLERLNALFLDESVDGVIVQLPLPQHIDEEAILEHIDPYKDVDGFHPLNVGRLAMRGVHPVFVPCTPLGSVELLTRYGIELTGKKAVILGNSNTVGMPLSMLLRDEGCASVTVCHCTAWDFLQHSGAGGAHPPHRSLTSDRVVRAAAEACLPPLQSGSGASGAGSRHLKASSVESIPEVTKTADVLFVAIGYPELVKRSWVKEGCIVVDIGINARPTNEKDNIEDLAKRMLANGSPPTSAVEIVGDVDYEEVSQVASYITPVPGGAGPMTIAALMNNLVSSYKTIVGGKPSGFYH